MNVAHALMRTASPLMAMQGAFTENFEASNAPPYMHKRRRLLHIYPENRWLLVTFHLHGALPQRLYPPPHATAGEAFVWIDRYLDSTRRGPMYLREPEIAQLVVDALHKGVEPGQYELGRFAVMANHVHLLILPKINPSELLKALKGSTAREANRVPGRTGESFWQRESYDRWVRDSTEYTRVAAYIENNPVKAGLVNRPEDYRWSSAFGVAMSGDTARTSACATGDSN